MSGQKSTGTVKWCALGLALAGALQRGEYHKCKSRARSCPMSHPAECCLGVPAADG